MLTIDLGSVIRKSVNCNLRLNYCNIKKYIGTPIPVPRARSRWRSVVLASEVLVVGAPNYQISCA